MLSNPPCATAIKFNTFPFCPISFWNRRPLKMNLLPLLVLTVSLTLVQCCDPGYFPNKVGDCVECPLGHYCTAGITEPVACPPGTFNPELASTSRSDCMPCPRGSASRVKGAAECKFCPAGKHNNRKGSRRCKACTPGHYCPKGSSKQIPCPSGTFSADRKATSVNTCEFCPAGTFGPNWGLVECLECPVGSYCPEGALEPNICHPGTYNNITGGETVEDCLSCPAGTYGSEAALTQCSGTCPAGSYCPEGSIIPAPCPEGTYNDRERSVSIDDCMMCPVGHYCEAGSEYPQRCPAGTYNNKNGIARLDSCMVCPVGFYCPLGAVEPILCPAGTYGPKLGLMYCLACPAGFYCVEGIDEPIPCPEAFFCEEGSSQPMPCPIGTYNDKTRSRSTEDCLLCPAGTYGPLVGLVECLVCPVNFYCPEGSAETTPCPDGQTSSTGSTSLDDCTQEV